MNSAGSKKNKNTNSPHMISLWGLCCHGSGSPWEPLQNNVIRLNIYIRRPLVGHQAEKDLFCNMHIGYPEILEIL